MLNPSLREEPREQRAAVIPARNESSLLDWLYSSGRMVARDTQETERQEEEEISGLIDVDDVTYDIDDDDDLADLEE